MQIAYLILAHNQPAQLERLIERLNGSNAHFFVHIDKKSRDKAAIFSSLVKYANVQVVSDYDVNWMGFNMVLSTLGLMRLAVSTGIDFKYFVLLSGQDYPIKGNQYINDFLGQHNEDFISFARISDAADNFKNKVRYYHYYDFPYSNPRNSKKVPMLVYLYYGIHKRLMKYVPERKFYKNMHPFFGSQWFALTGATVAYVLQFLDKNAGYLKFMKYTEGPDETFFQTIILNSERRWNVYDYKKFEEWEKTRRPGDNFIQEYSSLRYMDWSDRGKNVPKPATLDMEYFETLKHSTDLFARKFDENKSAALLNEIDNKLLNGK